MSELTTPHCTTAKDESAHLTPAGLQSASTLNRRRVTITALVGGTVAVLTALWAHLLGANGFDVLDVGLIACFLISAPWTVLGFWNAIIGFWLLHVDKRWRARVAPYLAAGNSDAPINAKTAVLMTLRNEDPKRALAKLERVRRSLDATGFGRQFHFYVLSDTSDPEIAAEEEKLVADWRAGLVGKHHIVYRRRKENTGFKAGNIRDFVERFGADYDLMLPLDADSLMSGPAILQMVRIMQRHPRLGILQSLVVGTPSNSAFARIFQFGMRHGMRSFTMGSAWWQGDCGPFWGHNALVRVKPFAVHCHLPVLPGDPPLGGYVLSHDQVEAAMMRGAGYEVRVMPVEGESWEDNPPTLLDFSKRDMRWCQGNMQYWRLLGLPRLTLTSRVQLFIAIMMYLSAAAWMAMVTLGAVKAASGKLEGLDPVIGIGLFVTVITMSLTPKMTGLADAALAPGGVARYGGALRFSLGALVEILFMMLLAPVIAFALTVFMAGLVFRRSVRWNGQARDAYRLTWRTAIKGLWPQTLFGAALIAVFAVFVPQILPWIAPMVVGLLLAVPLAVLSASPQLGAWFARWGGCAIPEEFEMPAELRDDTAPAPVELLGEIEASTAKELSPVSAG
ncbi:glucans biosynthesis glucosyltransferase MdoH [Dichotomicrobium thermohalophilum]|uniref:Glucans biosynthesis glucosyltransferase H n=1 Tax=Dichotomicrobium thermohalophilum TaxID=933063 RepID=A0A397Q260_9HYPH|nr:glucans biosynthesis glucosyltransferase MdoH [Dichotomicrobium thermohalophilum]RIA55023.1 membrane glycosyltransferase [Dichotomicrobium thermohalophilum]